MSHLFRSRLRSSRSFRSRKRNSCQTWSLLCRRRHDGTVTSSMDYRLKQKVPIDCILLLTTVKYTAIGRRKGKERKRNAERHEETSVTHCCPALSEWYRNALSECYPGLLEAAHSVVAGDLVIRTLPHRYDFRYIVLLQSAESVRLIAFTSFATRPVVH